MNAAEPRVAGVRRGRARATAPLAARAVFWAALGLYVVVPLLAMARFAFQAIPVARLSWGNVGQRWSARPLLDALTDEATLETGRRSLLLAACCIALTLAFLLPATLAVELRAPRLRTALTVLTMAPWVVPPIALVVGVAGTFRTTAPWFLSSPYSLVPFYTLWSLPFSHRALDAGLRSLNIGTLYEAAQSMGTPWPTFLLRVVLPNLRSAVLVVAALTGATVLGEFAFASLLLKRTLPTHLVVVQGSDPRAGLALALTVMVATTVVIGLAAALLRRRGLSFNAAGV